MESIIRVVFKFKEKKSPFVTEKDLLKIRKEILMSEERFLLKRSPSEGALFVVMAHSDFLPILNLLVTKFEVFLSNLQTEN